MRTRLTLLLSCLCLGSHAADVVLGRLSDLTWGGIGTNRVASFAQGIPPAGNGPAVTVQPASVTALTNSTVSFSLTATGDAPLSYQWQSNSVNLANVAGYFGATAATLWVSNVTVAQSNWAFRCVVTNAFGSVTSQVATLTVTNGGAAAVLQDAVTVPDSTYPETLYNWHYYSWPFVASNTYTLSSLSISAAQQGTPTVTVQMQVWTDVAGSPGTLLSGGAGATNAMSGAPFTRGDWTFTGYSCSIVSNTHYKLVAYVPDYPASGNWVLWYGAQVSGWSEQKSDGAPTWSWSTGSTTTRAGFKLYGQ